jgi:hypothetical protein
MESIAADLAKLLAKVNRPGDFCAAGTTELFAPSLHVEGVGPIALPLLPAQAASLIAAAEPAPYGRGQETLVDPTVRRTWQIAPDRVRIQGRHWQRTVDAIIARVAEGLGVDEPIDAEFYKLLIYDPGSFFVGHRDTEKAPGMFATLVIVLPSLSSGGELVVRHAGREERLDLRCEEPSEVAFAAFYADCVHEVLPVTDGCRLTLVYNLLRRRRGRALQPPDYAGEQERVAALLQRWQPGVPEKLVYPLGHAYTPAELGFSTLKGADAAVAGVLAAAAQQADCDLHLTLLTVEESGIAEYSDSYGRRGRWSGPRDDEFEAGEVTDRSVSLSEWRQPDGDTSALGELPVEEAAELCPPDAFADLEPDEEHFREATGNEGASFERTYQRAALVLWPRRRRLAVLCQAGLSVTLPLLEATVQRADAGEGDRREALRAEALELAGHMIEQWPTGRWYPRSEDKPGRAASMLTLLARLGAAPLIEAFFLRVTAEGDYGRGDNVAVLAALTRLAPERQAALLALIVEKRAAEAFGPCAALLAHAVGRLPDIRAAASRLVEAMPGDPANLAPGLAWRRGSLEPGHVADLLRALSATDRALVERAVTYALAWPKTYDLDRILVPALRDMKRSDPAIQPLRAACLAHLRARIAEPLAPPVDWRRASKVSCTCEHCRQLTAYLDDPAQRVWILRAVEHVRGHVEETIRRCHVDLDTRTDRHGRPYSLICSKNQASYERRAKQRVQDLADVAALGG